MDSNLFHGGNDEFEMSMNMFSNQDVPDVDPSHVWHDPDMSTDAFDPSGQKQTQFAPKSAQGDIVRRRDQVVEQFGQITPPDEDTSSFGAPSPADPSESKRKAQEDIAKKNRTQRARNAANTRHSKSKVARRDSMQEADSDMGEGKGQGKSTNVQREKNRLAAAKCRAKKKATSEDMQENHREGSKQNSYLHREVRELRDQKAFLRNSLLQHEPGVCQCHAIHRFNFAQAQQLAMGVGAMIGQPMSPSQESAGTVITPGSEASLGSQIHNGMARRPSMSSRPQSFNTGPTMNIGQNNSPGTYPAPATSADGSIPGQFADFIHSSPNGGRPGFM